MPTNLVRTIGVHMPYKRSHSPEKFHFCCKFSAHGQKSAMRSCFVIASDGPKFTRVITSTSYLVAVPVALARRRVNFQVTVLKVLAGHPEGYASLVDLKHYVAVLTCSGADWSQRMKRLAARAPELDIFSSGYVLREPSGWQITATGRDFLNSIEAPLAEPALTLVAHPTSVVSDPNHLPHNVVQLAGHKVQRARRVA
jgi:hypothetical protein